MPRKRPARRLLAKLKRKAIALAPAGLFRTASRLFGSRGSVFSGNYGTWSEAKGSSRGYEEEEILRRVREAAVRVKDGDAVFERDSVCFYAPEYRWPTVACLLRCAAKNHGRLHVLDFGGSLGSFYFQHRRLLEQLGELSWIVVEQRNVVECGRLEFEDRVLGFRELADESLAAEPVNCILCSATLQYLEKPYDVLRSLLGRRVPCVIIDRTAFVEAAADRLTLQHVSPTIYAAQYPAWFLSWDKFKKTVTEMGYHIVAELPCDEDLGIGIVKGILLENG